MWLMLFGMFMGIIISAIMFRMMLYKRDVGYLNIDRSDPSDNPYLFLELTKNLQVIQKNRHIVLTVKQQNYLGTRK